MAQRISVEPFFGGGGSLVVGFLLFSNLVSYIHIYIYTYKYIYIFRKGKCLILPRILLAVGLSLNVVPFAD